MKEQVGRKPSNGAMFLGLLIMLFGSLTFLMGCIAILEWRAEPVGLIAIGGAWVVVGATMCISGLWLLGSLGRVKLALQIGAVAILISGTALAAAASGVLQCSGPA